MIERARSFLILVFAASVPLAVSWPAGAQNAPADQTAAKAASAAPTLQERIDRLCLDLEKQRKSMHLPGIALTVVKDDQVILSRGFGVRDLENNLPVTEQTLFAIGSSTKAVTATVIGMLMDEGKLAWDDTARAHLPEFRLHDPDAAEQITIRDLLCHRSGLARTDMLWGAGRATRADILAAVAHAEPTEKFREKFQYQNVMYLAAGELAGRVADSSWDDLIAQRIFQPLGMTASNTSITAAQKSSHLSKGYDWDEEKCEFELKPMRNLDAIAPAGAINSCVKDMAQWVRLQLGRGTIDGTTLLSPERIEETWTKQIDIAGDVGYGLGWMVHNWNGKRLIEHGGNIDGFSAQVSLLPDENIGYVLLTNVSFTPLQSMSINLVFDTLLGEWNKAEPALDLAEAQRYLGKYHFDLMKIDCTVLIQNGNLAVDVPGQMVFELKLPGPDGRRPFAITDQIAVSFVTNQNEEVVAMKMYQAGMEFELPREGVTLPPEVTLDEVRPLLGKYHAEDLKADVTVLVQNGRLAVDVPGQMVYELHRPNEEGRWVVRIKPDISVRFNRNETDEVVSLTQVQNGAENVMPRVADAPEAASVPTLEDTLALQQRGYGSENLKHIKTLRLTGTLNFVNEGVSGTYEVLIAGRDRFRQHFDLGVFGYVTTVLDGDQAWTDSAFHGFDELSEELRAQFKLQHPFAAIGAWPETYTSINVREVAEINGRPCVVVDLALGEHGRSTIWLDAETGVALKEELEQTVEPIGPFTSTIQYDDYRDVDGVRLPFSAAMKNDIQGKLIMRIEKAEANVEIDEQAFVPPKKTDDERRSSGD